MSYFKHNAASVLFTVRDFEQSACVLQYFEPKFSEHLNVHHSELSASQIGDTPLARSWSSEPHQCLDWYLHHFND